jgi:hypothetical protein
MTAVVVQLWSRVALELALTALARGRAPDVCPRTASTWRAALTTDAVVFALDRARMDCAYKFKKSASASTRCAWDLSVLNKTERIPEYPATRQVIFVLILRLLHYQTAAVSDAASVFLGPLSWINLVQMARIALGGSAAEKHPPVTALAMIVNSATLRQENASAAAKPVAKSVLIPNFLFALDLVRLRRPAVICLVRVVYSKETAAPLGAAANFLRAGTFCREIFRVDVSFTYGSIKVGRVSK